MHPQHVAPSAIEPRQNDDLVARSYALEAFQHGRLEYQPGIRVLLRGPAWVPLPCRSKKTRPVRSALPQDEARSCDPAFSASRNFISTRAPLIPEPLFTSLSHSRSGGVSLLRHFKHFGGVFTGKR